MPPLPPLRLALAQVNPTVGAIAANTRKIAEWTERARNEGAELVIFPELVIPGYPAEDLYLKPHFLQANVDALNELAAGITGHHGADRVRRAGRYPARRAPPRPQRAGGRRRR